jgi:outer membrane protein assembly factor BamB
MQARHPCRRPTHATVALALLLLAGCSSAAGSRSSTPTASAPAAPAIHLAFLYSGAASTNVNAVRSSLVALSPRDGSVLWSHPLAASGATQIRPAYGFAPFEHDGVVYVGTAYDTPAATGLGAIEALDAATGAVRWQRAVEGAIAGTPAVDAGVVYLTASQQTTRGQGQGQGFAEALDARDGSVRWRTSLDASPSPPAAAGGRMDLFLTRQYPGGGTLLALNAADGTTAWRYDDPAPVVGGTDATTPPVIVGDTLFAEAVERDAGGGANVAILAFDPRTGARRWRYKTGGLAPLPAVAGSVACVSTFIPAQTGTSSVIAGLDLATGRERWRYARAVIASGCVAAGDTFAIAEDDRDHNTGFVVAFSAGDGREVWRRETGHALIANGAVPPAVTDGLVAAYAYAAHPASAGQTTATLLALRASDGAALWKVDAPSHQEQPPDIEGDTVYLQSATDLAAYALGDGALRWRFPLLRS